MLSLLSLEKKRNYNINNRNNNSSSSDNNNNMLLLLFTVNNNSCYFVLALAHRLRKHWNIIFHNHFIFIYFSN